MVLATVGWFAALPIHRRVEACGIVHHGFYQRWLDAISLSRLSQQGLCVPKTLSGVYRVTESAKLAQWQR
jgi:hypothetical protein